MQRLFALALITTSALAPASAIAQDALIGPDAWRELTDGKTLHYYQDGEPYGREYYEPGTNRVVFRAENGACAEGRWAHRDDTFCFAYFGELHCFEHVLRKGEIVVKGLQGDMEEQQVQEITDNEPLFCGEDIES